MSDAAERTIVGRVVDLDQRRIYPAEVSLVGSTIESITPIDEQSGLHYLLPGFIDAHVHIESSMLVPTEFAHAAVVHGTVATVSDPHEIGNVLGVDGVRYMQENASRSAMKFFFGAPACVPATEYETAGATITAAEVEELLDDPRILYLSEMMNFPGVLAGDDDCLAKIAAARQRNKPVDGHAPGLRGDDARRYIEAGITTDHECFTKEEALDKLAAGCKIAIREGSAARNFDALYTLLSEFPGQTMLCSDDKHPDELLAGHINRLVARACDRGVDLFDALDAACRTPIDHYGLPVGRLRPGDPADFVEVESLETFQVRRTWIDGQLVAVDGKSQMPRVEPAVKNQFVATRVASDDLAVAAEPGQQIQAIVALEGQLITERRLVDAAVRQGKAVSDPERDLLKLTVVNRYRPAKPAVAFIQNFGLQRGAMASSVAHDSHNVIGLGVDDEDLAEAVNTVMETGGGLSAVCGDVDARLVLPLPIAGLMATGSCREVSDAYLALDAAVKQWGSPLRAPYMTLSFMALLVIPELKLSDLGLFDGQKFEFAELLQPTS